jgi:hypothetical protein
MREWAGTSCGSRPTKTCHLLKELKAPANDSLADLPAPALILCLSAPYDFQDGSSAKALPVISSTMVSSHLVPRAASSPPKPCMKGI